MGGNLKIYIDRNSARQQNGVIYHENHFHKSIEAIQNKDGAMDC